MRASTLFAALVLVWPSAAFASFNGQLHFSFGAHVVFGVIGALPGALVVLLLEAKAVTWAPPSWQGALAAVALVYCVLRVTGLVGPAGDRGFYILPIPPLIELILITFVTSSRPRHAAGWAVAAAIVLLLGLAQALAPPSGARPGNASWGLIGGGAATTALLWRLGALFGERSLRRRHTPE